MFVLLLPDPAGLRITLPMVVYVCVYVLATAGTDSH